MRELKPLSSHTDLVQGENGVNTGKLSFEKMYDKFVKSNDKAHT